MTIATINIPYAGDIGEKRRHIEIPAQEPLEVPDTIEAPQPEEVPA